MNPQDNRLARSIFLLASTAACCVAHAQYKCVEDGRTTYAEMPCSPRATAVAIRVPEVTAEQANQARQAYLRQRSVVIEAMRDNLRAGRDPGLSTDIIRREQAITEIQIKQMEAEARRRR